MKGTFRAYRFGQPCPVCGHRTGWCMYKGAIDQPISVLCAREEKGCARDRSGKPIVAKDGMGYFHDLRKDLYFVPRSRPMFTKPSTPVHPFIAELAKEFHANMTMGEIVSLGEMLDLSAQSLHRLRVGWCKSYIDKTTGEVVGAKSFSFPAFSFPMRDEMERVIGIKFRNHARYKWSVKGSHNGLFIPAGRMPDGPLVVVEGPTDTGAVLDMGFAVIGRPGNTCGRELVVKYCRRAKRYGVVILRNNDPHGSDAERLTLIGVNSLAESLVAARATRWVKVIVPPVKDAREWKRAGATEKTIGAAINAAPYWKRPALTRAG